MKHEVTDGPAERTPEQLKRLAAYAEQKFWAAVADGLPEITSGDVDLLNSVGFSIDCQAMVNIWFRSNGGVIVPSRVDSTD